MRPFLALTLLLVPLLARAQEGQEQKTVAPPVQTVDPPQPTPTPKPQKGGFSLSTTSIGNGSAVGGNGEKLLGPLGKGLTLSGGWNLTGRTNSVSGSAQARSWYDFQNNNAFLNARPLGPLQQNLDLSVQGKLLGLIDVNATLTNDRFRANQQQVLGLNYDSKKGTRVSVGDVNASLSGNELVGFSRNLQGVYFSRDLNKTGMKLTSVASITRALTRRGSFQGNGTTGPYFLNAQQLMQGTETILLNGQKLVPGEDYRLDYFTGQLDLLKSRILNAQDTIEYTYEAQSFNTRSGVLTGLRFDLPQGANNFGFTLLSQRAGAGGVRGAARRVTQYFPVVGDINYRYFLQSPPQTDTPIEVRYQNRLLLEGADKDYIYNRSLNYLQLRIALPPDTSFTGISSLGVDYTPSVQSGTTGDKTVLGFDAGVALPAGGRLNFQLGQSGASGSQSGGTGMTLSTTFQSRSGAKRSWTLTNSLRSIEPGFSGIDSVASAFLRAERTLLTSFSYDPGSIWKADIRLTQGRQGNSLLGLGGASATPTSLTWARDSSLSMGFDITPVSKGRVPLPEFTIRHDQRGQSLDGTPSAGGGAASGATRSTFTSDSLNFRWSPKPGGALSLDGLIGRSASKGRSVFASGYTDSVGTGLSTGGNTVLDGYRSGIYGGSSTNSASTNANLNVRFHPSGRLSLTGSVGTSKTRFLSSADQSGGGGSGSTQTDIGLGLRYELSRALSLEWNASGGANGQSLAGFYGQSGSAAGQKTRNQNLSIRFAPSSGIDVLLGHRRQLSLIPGYDNSENVSTDLTATATLTPTFLINAQVMQQRNNYVSGSGASDNLSYALTTQHGPFGKLTLSSTLTRSAYGFGGGSSSGGGLGGGIGGVGGGFGGVGSGLGGGSLTGGFSDGAMTTFGLQASYDITGVSLFLRFASTNQTPGRESTASPGPTDALGGYHSSSNFRDGDLQVGAQWKLTDLIGATFSARLANRKDRDDPRYSYRARTFNVDVGLRF